MRAAGTSVTLRDVARATSVSITTVSRVLNGRESGVPISDETRLRVLTVAAEMGYKPNLFARGLRGSRSSLLGVIMRDVSDPFHIEILRGINDVARARDYRLFLGHIDYRAEVAVTYGSMFERSHADGILVVGDIDGGDAILDVLAQRHESIVGVSDRTGRRRIPGVYADSRVGTQLALEHLWSLGHRRITCVSDRQTYDGRSRSEVYEELMHEHGAGEAIQTHVVESPGSPEPSLRLGRTLFAGFEPSNAPTAIYATSDTIAIGLMQAAFQAGLSIPDQLSLVGYDNIAFSAYTVPPLTTIDQSGAELGRIAAQLLTDMIEEGRPGMDVDDVVLAPMLVVRRSTVALSAVAVPG